MTIEELLDILELIVDANCRTTDRKGNGQYTSRGLVMWDRALKALVTNGRLQDDNENNDDQGREFKTTRSANSPEDLTYEDLKIK